MTAAVQDTTTNLPKLIFVYNANSGLWNTIMDSLHKTASPDTYSCALCKLTYGVFTEVKEWKEFRQSFNGDMVFYHIDEFEKLYDPQTSYPVVLSEDEDGDMSTVISPQRMNEFRDHLELMDFCRDWAKIQQL